MKGKSVVFASVVVIGIAAAVMGLGRPSTSNAQFPECSGKYLGLRTYSFGGLKGEFKTPDEAVKENAKTELKEYEKLKFEKERTQSQDGREKSKYTVAKNDRVIAQYFVEERPEGGYEVGAMQLCAEEQKPDPAQP